MDLQKIMNNIIEKQAKDRGKYHLTYGELIKALKEAPSDAVVDKRFKGIGSWRGSYTEIAIYTEQKGFSAEKEEFNNYGGEGFQEKYRAWEKENVVSVAQLPQNANEMGKLLESLLGLQFTGYKGGNFTIEEHKPLWLEEDVSTYTSVAIVDIDYDLTLITKNVED